MKVTEKKCKGSGKAKGCGCGNLTLWRKYGLCRKCHADWWFNSYEGKKYYQRTVIPQGTKKLNAESKREKVNYSGKLQSKVQEIARLIDLGHPCLARNKMALSYDGGHVFGKGSHPECRYNLHNIFAQDSKSNHSTTEDALMLIGVENTFSKDYRLFVESLKNKPTEKHSKADYERFYRKACKIANELIKNGERFNNAQRIEMRNKINAELGIYNSNRNLYFKNEK